MIGLFEKYKVMLAPMAGVSDPPFRQLCIEQGADLTFTEMVSAKGLSYANDKTRHLIDLAENEKHVAVQLFGHEPYTMAEQAKWIESELGEKIVLIDINMGCPARKIVKKGDGSSLMKTPELASQIVTSVKKAISKPVSVKFRRGYEIGNDISRDFGILMQKSGADSLTLHGRFAMQLYKGNADWNCIKELKESVDIPVIGNGDIKSADDAVRIHESTGCDAVMIARAARGNPWIFSQIQAALNEDTPRPLPSHQQKLEMARRHARILDSRDRKSVVRMRKHAMWYIHGLPGASTARGRLNYCSSLEDFEAVFDEMLERMEE